VSKSRNPGAPCLTVVRSNAREDAPKLKWDGLRCQFEDAQSDILLLLDTCALKEAPAAGSHGLKQAIAAALPDYGPRDAGDRTFTSYLVDVLQKLAGRSFGTQRLYDEILVQRQQDLAQARSRMTNGDSKAPPPPEKLPVFFTITPGKGQGLTLGPLVPASTPRQPADADGQHSKPAGDDSLVDPIAAAGLTFDEQRVLVCTTFVGEASPDMAYFKHWNQNTPPLASKIAVEGMFIGPPTMLLISMPHAIWNVVQHDRVCCFLGYIGSHNLTHLYDRLLGPKPISSPTAKDVEVGRILLEARHEARQGPTGSPGAFRHDNGRPLYPETPTRHHGPLGPQPLAPGAPGHLSSAAATGPHKETVEETAEMKEAAEQLKALSHIRHINNEASPPQLPPAAAARGHGREDSRSSHGADESGADDARLQGQFGTPPSKGKGRKSLQGKGSKQDNRCQHCVAGPFKDSSSLRKHIQANHTRPFPCAFSFAGCTSTFGSKNEWKRHIASQHLCLYYYKCSSCPKTTAEGKGNEFNRKDLFTQHLRRMHAPFAIKKGFSKTDPQVQQEWDTFVRGMQESCLITRRRPPQLSACPKSDCKSVFEGSGAWDEWTEHVGRHMEKNEATNLGVDDHLAKWALDEGIIERHDDPEYRLCNQGIVGNEREMGFISSFASEADRPEDEDGVRLDEEAPGKQEAEEEVDDPSSITVATVAAAAAAVVAARDRNGSPDGDRYREKTQDEVHVHVKPVRDPTETQEAPETNEDKMDVDG